MIDATLLKVMERFGSEDKCRDYLETLRWPEGVTCPRCKCASVSQIVKRSQYDCNECRYQFSVKAGTIFNDSHLPLTKWLIVTYLITESRKGMSANQIKRIIGGSYKTAWYLCHRIRAAMAEAEKPMLSGVVEMDETFIGGKSTSEMRRKSKEVVIGIHGRKHKTIKHKDKVYVDGEVHTNTAESAFSLLKRGIIGTWHKISAKHLQAYLDEMTFRFNRRKRHDLFIDTLRHMVTADPLSFEKLTA
jgi:transposase-like protein